VNPLAGGTKTKVEDELYLAWFLMVFPSGSLISDAVRANQSQEKRKESRHNVRTNQHKTAPT
jgi:hypothetical protein